MRKTLVIGGLAALTLAGAGGVALAQQAPRAEAQVSRTDFVERRVARLTAADANQDGQVSADERKAARDSRMAERREGRFDRLDADKDGMISRAEFEARQQRAAERGPRNAQRAALRAERRATRAPVVIAEAQSRAEAAFARLDADSDGLVTVAERQTVRTERRAQRMERRAARQQQASPLAPASE